MPSVFCSNTRQVTSLWLKYMDWAVNSSEIPSTKPICLVLFISSIFGYVIQNVFFQESAEIETEKPP